MRCWKRSTLLHTGVFVVYALLTFVMTWPLAAGLNTRLIGNGDDMWVHYWNNWWVKRVLLQGEELFYTPLLFHPTGVSLLYHNFAWVNIALWLILEPLAGDIAAYNLAHLVHIPLCGLAMFLLVSRLTQSNSGGFVSGLVYAFWPYRMLDVNHPNMVSTEGFPLLMLALIQLVEDDNPLRDGILVGALVALIGYTRWQLLILAGVMVSLYLLYSLIWKRGQWTWNRAAALALAGVVALSLLTPGLYPLVRDQLLRGVSDGLYVVSSSDPEQDLLAWIVPQHQHPLGRLYTRLFSGYGQSEARERYSAFVGYVASGLAILGTVRCRRSERVWFWVFLAFLCFVMALGPSLQVNGVIYNDISLPYRLVGWLPPIQLLRHPHRFTALLGLPVGVLVGHGVRSLRQWLEDQGGLRGLSRAGVVTCLLGSLILVDYCSIPTANVSAAVPHFYETIAADTTDSAVVGLPGERQATERYMYYQTEHGHPMLGGHVSRLPSGALAFASSVPLVKGMYRDGGLNTSASDISHQLSLLAEAGFRYIVIHKKLTRPEVADDWQAYLAMAPRYEDEEIAVYTTVPVAWKDYVLEHELVPGMGLVRTALSGDEGSPEPELSLEVVWGALEPPEKDLQVEVLLLGEKGVGEEVHHFEISPQWPLQLWSADTIVRDTYTMSIGPSLKEGSYSVAIGLVDRKDGQIAGQKVDIGAVIVGRSKSGRGVFPIDQRMRASFGDRLRLMGYGLEVESDRIRIILHWQATRGVDEDYKFFVHLCDAETNRLAAQADVMPLEWTYPTSQWGAGEVVSDDVLLPIEDVPPGDYRLLVGVYSPDSGERLPIGARLIEFDTQRNSLVLPDTISR